MQTCISACSLLFVYNPYMFPFNLTNVPFTWSPLFFYFFTTNFMFITWDLAKAVHSGAVLQSYAMCETVLLCEDTSLAVTSRTWD